MNHDVIITCALTGAGDTTSRSPHVPVTPKQIAAAAVEAAKAGATVVHCHVRDPQTGKFSRDVALYREVMERIREADIDIIVNLTAGMGGDLEIGGGENPMEFGPNTDLVGPLTRLAHVEELLPEICTLDCGTLNFGDGDTIYVSTPAQLRAGAKRIQELGVKAELEIFDTGHLWFAKQMIKEGLLDHGFHGGGVSRRTPGDAQAQLEQWVDQQTFLDHVLGEPQVAGVENLQLGLHAQLGDALGAGAQLLRCRDIDGVAVAEVEGAAIQGADFR